MPNRLGTFIDHSKKSYQILVSVDALTMLYKLMCSLLDEVREVDMLFRLITGAQRPGKWNERTRVIDEFDDDLLKPRTL